MKFQIKEGSFYRRVDDLIVGPMRPSGLSRFPWTCGRISYTDEGYVCADYRKDPANLIKEVIMNPSEEKVPQVWKVFGPDCWIDCRDRESAIHEAKLMSAEYPDEIYYVMCAIEAYKSVSETVKMEIES